MSTQHVRQSQSGICEKCSVGTRSERMQFCYMRRAPAELYAPNLLTVRPAESFVRTRGVAALPAQPAAAAIYPRVLATGGAPRGTETVK